MNTQKVFKLIKNNPNGCSIDRKGLEYRPKHGFFVSITNNVFNTITPATIKRIVKLANSLPLDQWYLGYWYDHKAKKHYLDVSLHILDQKMAVKLGKLFNQQAIFDCGAIKSIYLSI